MSLSFLVTITVTIGVTLFFAAAAEIPMLVSLNSFIRKYLIASYKALHYSTVIYICMYLLHIYMT